MKIAFYLLPWLAFLPGSVGMWDDPAASDPRPFSTMSVTGHTPDLCMSTGHNPASQSSSVCYEWACEEEESSDSEVLAGCTCLTSEAPTPPRISSLNPSWLWDVAHPAPRSALLRC